MDRLGLVFLTFAGECQGSSPLYQALSREIARDPQLLGVAESAPAGQPVPNLLFAAVHALLLRGKDRSLGGYYASLVDHPLPAGEAFPAFRDYVLRHQEEIREILAVRLVQTNEVRRSIYIASAFARLAREFPGRPFSLIELGASAGLNLLWDRFSYEYTGHPPFGDLSSPLRLQSELRVDRVPPSDLSGLQVVGRVGFDLNPLDVQRPEDLFWLRALIWPEHAERRILFDRAVAIQRSTPVRLIAGDGVALLPEFIKEIDPNVLVGLYHTHVANQLSLEARATLLASVDETGRSRDLIHLHNNIEPHLHATFYRNGERHDLPLARTDGHARWVEWLD